MVRRFHQETHFRMNDLILYYSFPVLPDKAKKFKKCHHIDKMRCSRAKELTPTQCIEERKCELQANQELLFFKEGIDVRALQALDKALRGN